MRRGRKYWVVVGMIIFGVTGLVPSAFCQPDKTSREELYKNIDIFADSLAIVQTEYVDDVAPRDLIYGALKGMLASLDAYSQFLDPEEYKDLRVETEGKFGGLGIEISIKDDLITVITPLEDSPAWKAGVMALDRIVKIGEESTRNFTLQDAVKRLRGEPGTKVSFTVWREGENRLIDFTLERIIITMKDIKAAKVFPGQIGYIRLAEFRESTVKDFAAVLENLKKQGIVGLILDLRNNPGGLLDVAIRITEMFLPADKLVVYTQGKAPKQKHEFKSNRKDPLLDLPMVVLINGGSASGSEILAGALQDYRRALIIGTTTFGKGSVQTIVPLVDGSALRLTTSKYYTPQGRTILGKGIAPDIAVKPQPGARQVKEEVKSEEKVKEAFAKVETKETEGEKEEELPPSEDAQLNRALEILQGISIYQNRIDSKSRL